MTEVVLFDFDGTIVPDYSLLYFHFAKNLPFLSTITKSLVLLVFLPIFIILYCFKIINSNDFTQIVIYILFRNVKIHDVDKSAQIFSANICNIIYPHILKTIRQYQQNGAIVYIVTASFDKLISDFCNKYNIGYIGTEFETKGNIYTGYIKGNVCIGHEKVRKIKNTFINKNVIFKAAYGNRLSDIPMLTLAENAFVINPKGNKFKQIIKEKGWNTIIL